MKLATSLNLLFERTGHDDYFNSDNYLKAIQLCNDCGFNTLDWNASDYVYPETKQISKALTGENWRTHIEGMRNKAEQLGMTFNQCHSFMYNYFENSDHTKYLSSFEERVMDACKILGIARIVYHPVAPPQFRETKDVNACKEANSTYLRTVAEKAAMRGIEIAIENMFVSNQKDGTPFWRYCSKPEELVDLVDTIDMENVCICMDVGHAHIMAENLPDTISYYGKRLKALHISDNDGYSDQHLMPFLGTIDWTSVMKALYEVGYAGEFTYEIHNSTIRMPVELRKLMLRESFEVGQWLLRTYEGFCSKQ